MPRFHALIRCHAMYLYLFPRHIMYLYTLPCQVMYLYLFPLSVMPCFHALIRCHAMLCTMISNHGMSWRCPRERYRLIDLPDLVFTIVEHENKTFSKMLNPSFEAPNQLFNINWNQTGAQWEIFSVSCLSKTNSDCNNTFLIDLAPNEIPFGAVSIVKM